MNIVIIEDENLSAEHLTNLLQKIDALQNELISTKNRLRLYES